MKYSILILLFPFLLPAQGIYRWDVKIGVDTAGQRVFKMKAKTTSIKTLASAKSNPRPEQKEIQKGLRANEEKRKVTVTAYVTGLVEENDGDYHLVLTALSGTTTLVGEIPMPKQPKLKGFPTYKKLYGEARDYVDSKIQKPTSTFKEITPVKVTVTGYIFFDVHSKTGKVHSHGTAVENAIEIHPILKIKLAK